MVLKGGLSDPNVLPLSKMFEFVLQNLCVPDLAGFVNNSDFKRVLVELEHLDDLALQVKIVVLIVFLSSLEVCQLCDETLGNHFMVRKWGCNPLSDLFESNHLTCFKRQLLTRKRHWSVFYFPRCFFHHLGREECPRAVEEYVGCKLFAILPNLVICSMDSDDVANPLSLGQIFKLVGKQHKCVVVDLVFFIYLAGWVSDFHWHYPFVGFETLVWELGIQDNGIKMQPFGAGCELIQLHVFVWASTIISGSWLFVSCLFRFIHFCNKFKNFIFNFEKIWR
jgi:hypothetical protein